MTVKPGTENRSRIRLPKTSWMVRLSYAAIGSIMLGAAGILPLLGARENNASLALAEAEQTGFIDIPARSPLSFQGRAALLERCATALSSLRFALLEDMEKNSLVDGCARIADENPEMAEAHLTKARISLLGMDRGSSLAELAAAQVAAPGDGWLALQRIRTFFAVFPPGIEATATSYSLRGDLAVLLEGRFYLETLARDLLRQPEIRASLFPALESLGPEASRRFLSAFHHVKETP